MYRARAQASVYTRSLPEHILHTEVRAEGERTSKGKVTRTIGVLDGLGTMKTSYKHNTVEESTQKFWVFFA